MYEYLDCSFLFCEVWIQHLSVLFVSIFPVQNLKLPCANSGAWKTSAQKFSDQTTSQQNIRIGFRKKISWQKNSNQLPGKKKRTSPVKQKNIAPSLAHKKEEDDKTISQIERIVQDWLQMAYKGWRYLL